MQEIFLNKLTSQSINARNISKQINMFSQYYGVTLPCHSQKPTYVFSSVVSYLLSYRAFYWMFLAWLMFRVRCW